MKETDCNKCKWAKVIDATKNNIKCTCLQIERLDFSGGKMQCSGFEEDTNNENAE